LSYHLGKVIHWAQNSSANYYPTNILRQISQPPASEYIYLQLFLLSGNDKYINLVSVSIFILLIISLVLLAKQLKLPEPAIKPTLFFYISLPAVILLSSSAKNDLHLVLWLTVFYFFFLKTAEKGKLSDSMLSGLALGIAILTKSSAYIFSIPLLVIFGVKGTLRHGKRFILVLFCLLSAVLILNFPTMETKQLAEGICNSIFNESLRYYIGVIRIPKNPLSANLLSEAQPTRWLSSWLPL